MEKGEPAAGVQQAITSPIAEPSLKEIADEVREADLEGVAVGVGAGARSAMTSTSGVMVITSLALAIASLWTGLLTEVAVVPLI